MVKSCELEVRNGPAGQRAALVGGPDIWELVATVGLPLLRGEMTIREAVERLDLSESQIRAGLLYYTEYPDEVNEWIRRSLDGADDAEAAWRRGMRGAD